MVGGECGGVKGLTTPNEEVEDFDEAGKKRNFKRLLPCLTANFKRLLPCRAANFKRLLPCRTAKTTNSHTNFT